MDLPKLISILEKRALFFSRVSELKEYDKFEGNYPKEMAKKMKEGRLHALTEITDQMRKNGAPEKMINEYMKMADDAPSADQSFRELACVNCWHMSHYESAAMWAAYTNKDYGIAIQSTFSDLCDAFEETDRDVHIGIITYLDYSSDIMLGANALHPIMHKRMSFEYEKELRALVLDVGDYSKYTESEYQSEITRKKKGIYIPVNIFRLIRTIRVAPQAAPWIVDVVGSVSFKYDLKVEIVHSELDQTPY